MNPALTVMEGDGTVQVCAELDLPNGKHLGSDIEIIFMDSSGSLTSMADLYCSMADFILYFYIILHSCHR